LQYKVWLALARTDFDEFLIVIKTRFQMKVEKEIRRLCHLPLKWDIFVLPKEDAKFILSKFKLNTLYKMVNKEE
jgi:hypothetical protein